MKFSHLFCAAILLFSLFLLSSPVIAQEGGAEKPAAVTAKDPAISVDELALLLKPLTKTELETEIKAWKGLLREKAQAVTNKDLQALKATGADKTGFLEEANKLRSDQNAVAERVTVVIKALDAKGGDIEEHKKYVAAATGLSVKVTDFAAIWVTVKEWLTSSEGGLLWLKNIVLFIVTLIIFRIIAGILSGLVRRAVTKLQKGSELLRDFFVNTIRRVVFLIGIVIALSFLGIDIGPLLAAIGVVGFVIGFALQGTLSNFANGVMILLYRPYDIGDVVDVAGVKGVVNAMSLVSTTIKSFDNQNIIVPNSQIWGGIITNATANDTRRIDMTFGISYSDDIGKAQGIIEEIIKAHELVLKDPEPLVRMHELADSSVNFIARPWSKTTDYWAIYWDVNRAVKERFDKEGISIPFPQRDVHVYKEEA